jgi:hypothetical protein
VAPNDQDFGLVRLTLGAANRSLVGELFAVSQEEGEEGVTARRDDSFTLDLQSHKLR